MKIKVTQDHIRLGVREDCHACPIAVALASIGMESVTVMDDNNNLDFWDPKKQEPRHCKLPDEAVEWVQRYDAGSYVEPFEFEVRD